MDKPDKLSERIGVHLDRKTEMERQEWPLNYCRAMNQEIAEMTDYVPWKWWAKYQRYDTQNASFEVVELRHFLISATQILVVAADDLFEAYPKKHRVNLDRAVDYFPNCP
jgi:hypothetical protein